MINKKQFNRSLLLVFFITLVIGCQCINSAYAEDEAFIVEKNIIYGKGGDVDLKLDLVRPAKGKGPYPALIFIHGGYWNSGSRTVYHSEIREAAERGYVAITVDYRLTNVKENGKVKYTFPAQVHDVKCAVRWIRANRRKYKIDPNRIGVIGRSAGGHLALMLGLTAPSDGLEGECGNMKYSSGVQIVINISGSTDLISEYEETRDPIFKDFMGGTLEEVPEQYEMASPVFYASKDDPTVLSIHGELARGEAQQAEILDAKMKEVGASHTVVIKKGKSHAIPIDDDVWDFFDEYLKGD